MKRLYIIERFESKEHGTKYVTHFASWDYDEALNFFNNYVTSNQLTLDEGMTFKTLVSKN